MRQGRETPQPEMPRNRGCRPPGSSSGPRHGMALDSIDLAISSLPSPSAHGARGVRSSKIRDATATGTSRVAEPAKRAEDDPHSGPCGVSSL